MPRGCLDEIWGVPLIPLRHPGPVRAGRLAKRAFDAASAAALLILTVPLLAAAGLAVRRRLRHPALFRQVRIVGPGRQAEIVKLRTLGQHGDPDTSWAVPAGRCGRLGRFLRVTHIDELPQLASVLRGDMSLVGPRPERPHFARQFAAAVPGYAGRHRMPAGLTGWAQVHGLNGDTSISDRARFDNYYIEYWSFWLDLLDPGPHRDQHRGGGGPVGRPAPRCAPGRAAGRPGPRAGDRPGPRAAGPRSRTRRSLMKVLHVITGLGVGGAELQLRSILQHTRHDSEVVTLYNPGPVADMIRADGGRVADLGMTRNTQLSALLRLRRLIRHGGYDVVHTHLYRSQVYGRPAAWLAATPVVLSTEHSIGETHLERRPMTRGVRALYLATELLSDATIAVSGAVRERLLAWGVRDRRVTVIPNGVDLQRVAFDASARGRVRAGFGIPDDAYVIGVLGRLDPNKQFDMVIEAAAPLLGERTRLLIVGQGDERDRLEQAARDSGAAGQVIFAGERHDVAAMLSAMDLFVASSRQETFGLSVLEALANGAPVLYTTCPALDGLDAGRAHQVPSTAAGLRAAMAAELRAGRRPRTAEPAVEKEYSIEAVTARIDDLYERLAGRRTWRTVLRPARPRTGGTR